jgi:hypothetical protein
VLLVNGDGGYVLLPEALYYTADCATPGYYGMRNACIACPAGGQCPGGNRVWPAAGFYGTNESDARSLAVCMPSARCTGGRRSECRAGYAGAFCSRCAAGFEPIDSSTCCVMCAPTAAR